MKSKYLKIIIISILFIFIVNCAIYFSAVQSEAYTVAINKVKEEYGDDINYHLHYLGYKINTDGNKGHANFVINANIKSIPYKAYVSLVQKNGAWTVSSLRLKGSVTNEDHLHEYDPK